MLKCSCVGSCSWTRAMHSTIKPYRIRTCRSRPIERTTRRQSYVFTVHIERVRPTRKHKIQFQAMFLPLQTSAVDSKVHCEKCGVRRSMCVDAKVRNILLEMFNTDNRQQLQLWKPFIAINIRLHHIVVDATPNKRHNISHSSRERRIEIG